MVLLCMSLLELIGRTEVRLLNVTTPQAMLLHPHVEMLLNLIYFSLQSPPFASSSPSFGLTK